MSGFCNGGDAAIAAWNRRSAISPAPAPSTAPAGMTEEQREALVWGAVALESDKKLTAADLHYAAILRALAKGGE